MTSTKRKAFRVLYVVSYVIGIIGMINLCGIALLDCWHINTYLEADGVDWYFREWWYLIYLWPRIVHWWPSYLIALVLASFLWLKELFRDAEA